MSPDNWNTFVQAVLIIAVSFSALVSYLAKSKIGTVEEKVDENKVAMNHRLDALVATSEKIAREIGRKEGIQEERAEAAAKEVDALKRTEAVSQGRAAGRLEEKAAQTATQPPPPAAADTTQGGN